MADVRKKLFLLTFSLLQCFECIGEFLGACGDFSLNELTRSDLFLLRIFKALCHVIKMLR
ncbi:hypothetical protein GMA8713_05216 [Grimontia marina]|uniref:Uncharacterized protein n=1 Tax=Grimontia marina TaxID=646534 RepID=A0A128FK42_9GAMM|nr:hypothetical protein GMA8713_05216 [Grimontia marina]